MRMPAAEPWSTAVSSPRACNQASRLASQLRRRPVPAISAAHPGRVNSGAGEVAGRPSRSTKARRADSASMRRVACSIARCAAASHRACDQAGAQRWSRTA